MVVANIKHERGGAIDRLGTEDSAAGADAFQAVIPRPGFAAHGQCSAIGKSETA